MTEKKKTGFASMDKDKQREIASKGGKSAQAKGKGHKWTKEQAAEAGRKGGLAFHKKRREEIAKEMEQRRQNVEQAKDLVFYATAPSSILNEHPETPGSTEKEMDLAFQAEIAEKDQRAEQ